MYSHQLQSAIEPLVSVVMPVWNRERFLAAAIDSVLSQTYRNFELIIVDDGSEDSSVDIIRSYQSRDDRIRFISMPSNQGHSVAKNLGIEAATGEYIAFMDSDDISLPDRLRRQVSFLQDNPEIDAVGPYAQETSEDLSPVPEKARFMSRLACDHTLILFDHYTVARAMIVGALMIRAGLLRTMGGFDPAIRYSAEGDFFHRLFQIAGVRVANIPEILYLARYHDANWSGSLGWRERKAFLLRLYLIRLRSVYPAATSQTVARFQRLRRRHKLNWAERRAAKRDYKRVTEGMIARQLVSASERSILAAEMNRRLEEASPRLWQKFCHWYRYRIQRRTIQ